MEVAIVSKAKQGFIYRYLKENGITSKGLAGKIGITEQTMCSIINFKWTPTSKRENVAGKK